MGDNNIWRSLSSDLFCMSCGVDNVWYNSERSISLDWSIVLTERSGRILSIGTFKGYLASFCLTYFSGSLQTFMRLSSRFVSSRWVIKDTILAHSISTAPICFSKLNSLNIWKYLNHCKSAIFKGLHWTNLLKDWGKSFSRISGKLWKKL